MRRFIQDFGMTNRTNDRNQSLDLVKILAMLGVLCLHSNVGKQDSVVAFTMTTIAGISIPLFFMTSGYLLWNRTIGYDYSWKKIKGIIRFCFIICFFYWLIFDLIKGSWPTEVLHDFFEGFFQGGHLWMFWYFGAMIILYLLLPLTSVLNNKYSHFGDCLIGALLLCISVTFILNVQFDFERRYINQTMRLWNWIFYFGLGGLICKYENSIKKIRRRFFLVLLVLSALGFMGFRLFMKANLSGIEYYFGSFPCVIYAITAFLFSLRQEIMSNRWISILSEMFLPVYALHWIVLTYTSRIETSFVGIFSPIADFLILCIAMLSLSYILMRTPYVKSIFRL